VGLAPQNRDESSLGSERKGLFTHERSLMRAGHFQFDLSVNTGKCGIGHNKTSARNRARRYGFGSKAGFACQGGGRWLRTGGLDCGDPRGWLVSIRKDRTSVVLGSKVRIASFIVFDGRRPASWIRMFSKDCRSVGSCGRQAAMPRNQRDFERRGDGDNSVFHPEYRGPSGKA
jgi:hypothetical protein